MSVGAIVQDVYTGLTGTIYSKCITNVGSHDIVRYNIKWEDGTCGYAINHSIYSRNPFLKVISSGTL
tara:strand:- start:2 stop:202 length:201 start_codon:yes stop_codon:yes gene_type:complete